jgi:hypothetical protein
MKLGSLEFTAEDFEHCDLSDESHAAQANAILLAKLEKAPEAFGKLTNIGDDATHPEEWDFCFRFTDTHRARLVMIEPIVDEQKEMK